MKTGTVAKRFDLDPKTVTGWTDMFAEFFTAQAKAVGEIQRDYQIEDLWVINTIKVERSKNVPFEQIRARLATEDFDTNLPPEFTAIEGDSAITVYAEMREMRTKLEAAEIEIERLRQVAENERKRADSEREATQVKIGQLIHDAAVWQTRYEMLDEQMKNMKKKNDE